MYCYTSDPSLADLLLLPTRVLQLTNMFEDPSEFNQSEDYKGTMTKVSLPHFFSSYPFSPLFFTKQSYRNALLRQYVISRKQIPRKY
jgi:hypothetical protein